MKLKISLLALLLVAGACGGDDAEQNTEATAADTTAASAETLAPTTTAVPETSAAPAVAVATSGLGDILVDGAGNSLYLFVPDNQGLSTCYDACADAWPPLVDEVAAGDGVDASLIGSVTRDDGAVQVTYNGWPLYYFAGDTANGDVNGQGVNDVWYVLDPAGNAVE